MQQPVSEAAETGAQCIDDARALGPVILKSRDLTERDRRLAPDIVEGLRTARLCRWGLPAAQLGLPISPVEWLRILEILAGFEASVPWIIWNNMAVCLFARYLEPEARSELFGDTAWIYAQANRPTGRATPDGDCYRINGKWTLVSGCEIANCLALACIVEEDGGSPKGQGMPDMRFVFVPREQAKILDTWHVGSMRGTGSHDIEVHDVRVPKRHSIAPGQASGIEGPLGCVPTIVMGGAGLAAQILGMAQSSLDVVTEMARTRVTASPMPDLRDRPAAAIEVAGQAAAVDAARDHLHNRVARVWDRAQNGQSGDPAEIADAFAAAIHAMDVGSGTIDAMFATAGTAALYNDSPLERAHRDIHAMMRHFHAQRVWLEDAGRLRFGLEPQNPRFLL